MDKPFVKVLNLPSGARLIRFSKLEDAFYYDSPEYNPDGIGVRRLDYDSERDDDVKQYLQNRRTLDQRKMNIINRAQKELAIDKDFLQLVYKGKSQKRKFELNKFVGSLSMTQYAIGAEKQFERGVPGAKKQVLNLAFQVGTFVGGNYTESFVKILKTIIMCQAMNISVNIDMFDSDVTALRECKAYTLINVARSSEKLNFKEILVASHQEFFNYTLFNSYSAGGEVNRIGGYIGERRLIEDLSPFYDVIGGNSLSEEARDQGSLVSKVIKIGMR